MNTPTLSELFSNLRISTPYEKSVVVGVVARGDIRTFTSDAGEEKKCLNVAVADSTREVKCIVYDERIFHRFQEGKVIKIRNSIRKPDGVLVVTIYSRIFPGPVDSLAIPQNIKTAAIMLIRPPAADVQPIKTALASPQKMKVSIRGKIIQEEAPREVTVKNSKVKIKTIVLEDTTGKAKVSLWRESSTTNIRPGDFVTVTDVVTNVFRNETSFNTTTLTTIQVTEAPEEIKEISICGACVDQQTIILLLDDDSEMTVPIEVMKKAFAVDIQDMEDHITQLCAPSIAASVTLKGADVVAIVLLS